MERDPTAQPPKKLQKGSGPEGPLVTPRSSPRRSKSLEGIDAEALLNVKVKLPPRVLRALDRFVEKKRAEATRIDIKGTLDGRKSN